MRSQGLARSLCISAGCVLVFAVLVTAAPASAQTTYRFERRWPTLVQPWYFFQAGSVDVDNEGNVYVAESSYGRIMKFTKDGVFITQFGRPGTDPGEFDGALAVALDASDYVYVLDDNKVQKFTPEGVYDGVTWGEAPGPGELHWPIDIAVYRSEAVYVTDMTGNTVNRYDTEGNLDWQYPVDTPYGVAVNDDGYAFVASRGDDMVHVVDPDGSKVDEWDPTREPFGLALDAEGNVYVAYFWSIGVKKFTPDGVLLEEWGSEQDRVPAVVNLAVSKVNGDVYYAAQTVVGKLDPVGDRSVWWTSRGLDYGWFIEAGGVEVDGDDYVYAVDHALGYVQRVSAQGVLDTSWAVTDAGQFEAAPFGEGSDLAFDSEGNLYALSENQVTVFSSSGEYVTEWTPEEPSPGPFSYATGIAIYHDPDRVFITDMGNDRVLAFLPDGTSVGQLGGVEGTDPGEFDGPGGIAFDSAGYLYISELNNHRVQKFNPAGLYVDQWGKMDGGVPVSGDGDGEFYGPAHIAIDSADNVYVVDMGNNRIQQFSTDGVYQGQWGTMGSWAGQFFGPMGIAADSTGAVLVSDYVNARVQKFRPVVLSANTKAIVVAAGGPYIGNNLWNATQFCASYAYNALIHQGFTHETIQYLSSDTDLDLDDNPETSEVDGDVTSSNLQDALETWGPALLNGLPTEDVVVYLTDHGGPGTFRLSGTETLDASDLDSWLDTLQAGITGTLTVVYDACESGTFLSQLSASSNRIAITSTSPGESAYFVTTGTVSFSNYFWTQIFKGLSVGEAFSLASSALSETLVYQTPLLDASGDVNAATTYIGSGTSQYVDGPEIGAISPPQVITGTATATLWADPVTDPDGVGRVWAVLRPPDYDQASSDNPVTGLPNVDLSYTEGDRYEGTYEAFTTPGTYEILIYARDRFGNTSEPQYTSVSVSEPLSRKALLVAGSSNLSPPLWPAMEYAASVAYEALHFQGYDDEDLYYLSRTTTTGVDGLATIGNIRWALQSWAHEETQDLTVVLVGEGTASGFALSDSETLTAPQLDEWLDEVQGAIPGKVVVVYDGDYSGSFLPALTPPPDSDRIVVSSAGPAQTAGFLNEGTVSFTKYFWVQVLNGANVADAFTYAGQGMVNTGRGQVAQLDDTGDGVSSPKLGDGDLARRYWIGSGILLAGDDPLIGSIVGAQELGEGVTSALLWVDDVTTTGTIDRVVALITPPGGGAPDTFELTEAGDGYYEGTYSDFTVFGTYQVSVTAVDTEEAVSLPALTTVTTRDGADAYEVDDTHPAATWIGLNAVEDQWHNIHDLGDEDWVIFYAQLGDVVTVETLNLDVNSDTYVELYRSDGTTFIASNDDYFLELRSYLTWPVDADGFYLVKVVQSPYIIPPFPTHGVDTGYDLRVWKEDAPEFIAQLTVYVYNTAGAPISGAEVTLDKQFDPLFVRTELTDDGHVLFGGLEEGVYTVTADAPGYAPTPTATWVSFDAGEGTTDKSVDLTLEADDSYLWGELSADGRVGTVDASLIIQWIVSGRPIDFFPIGVYDPFPPAGDVSGDAFLGTLDASLILQKRVGLMSVFPADGESGEAGHGDGYGPDGAKDGAGGAAYGSPVTRHCTLPDCLDVLADDMVSVPLHVDQAEGVLGYFFEVSYDAAVLEFVDVGRGELLGVWGDPEWKAAPGRVKVAGAAATALSGSGDLLALRFRGRPGAVGRTCALHFEAAALNDGWIPAVGGDGQVVVWGSGTATLAAPSGLEAVPGEAFEVPVILGNASDVVGYYFELSYDSSLLTCTGATSGAFAPGWSVEANPQSGHVTVGGYGATPLDGSGTIVVLQFQVLPEATGGASPLTFQYAELNDDPGIDVTLYDGDVSVAGGMPLGWPPLVTVLLVVCLFAVRRRNRQLRC